MFTKYKFKNWAKTTPDNLIEYLATPSMPSLKLVNFIYQKLFRINANVNFMVHFTSTVMGKKIYLGKKVVQSFANSGHCYIQSINGVYIGDHTIFAPGVKIISANHNPGDYDTHDTNIGPIRIGKNCWIGANAVILPGVTLGDQVIVGAGSVVTKTFGNNVVIAGVPAKVIKVNQAV